MCRRSKTALAFVFVLVCVSCTSLEERVFKFPLTPVELPEVSDSLSLTKIIDIKHSFLDFRIYDSVIVEYATSGSYGLIALSIESGDTLVNLCRKGRGPNEALLIAPYYDIVDGVAGLLDIQTSKYFEVNMPESIRTGNTVIDREVFLLDTVFPIVYNTIRVGTDSLFCYDAKVNLISDKLNGNPGFSLFDLKDGKRIAEYALAKKASIKLKKKSPLYPSILLNFQHCIIPEKHCICMAFISFPIVAFFDYREGTFRGVKIIGLPEFDQMKDTVYFEGVEYADDSIYLLYRGITYAQGSQDEQLSKPCSKLIRMDFSGNITGCYELDDSYRKFQYSNGTFYFASGSNIEALYSMDIASLKTSVM